jgi:hypothetical protein
MAAKTSYITGALKWQFCKQWSLLGNRWIISGRSNRNLGKAFPARCVQLSLETAVSRVKELRMGIFLCVKGGRPVSPPSLNRFSRKDGSLAVAQSYGPIRTFKEYFGFFTPKTTIWTIKNTSKYEEACVKTKPMVIRYSPRRVHH